MLLMWAFWLNSFDGGNVLFSVDKTWMLSFAMPVIPPLGDARNDLSTKRSEPVNAAGECPAPTVHRFTMFYLIQNASAVARLFRSDPDVFPDLLIGELLL